MKKQPAARVEKTRDPESHHSSSKFFLLSKSFPCYFNIASRVCLFPFLLAGIASSPLLSNTCNSPRSYLHPSHRSHLSSGYYHHCHYRHSSNWFISVSSTTTVIVQFLILPPHQQLLSLLNLIIYLLICRHERFAQVGKPSSRYKETYLFLKLELLPSVRVRTESAKICKS